MAMGIDQEIQRRMDAYRGNPQGLQQRYQMSQQLLDLLALQKLKSEKDAVARQMQTQMQQMPGTVAQQLEQEMVGRTKQDLAQQTAGVLQQKQRQQQKAMQQMAQQMAQRNVPQGGIAGLAPQGARPAPRMAGGGIVAFASGGTEEDAKLRARVETALELGASQEEIANLLARIGKSPEAFGLDALVPSQLRQMAAAQAPRAEGLRFQRPSASSTLAAIEALPVSSATTPMPMRAADQLTQALARGPQVIPPKAGSLVAPPSESGPRPEAGSLVGNPFEQRSQLKDQINARLEELDVRRFRGGSERFLPEERKQDIAEADRLRRNLAILQGGGNDPEKTAAAVRSVERNMVAGGVGRVVDQARGDDRDIEALLADPMFAMAAAEKKPGTQKIAPQTTAPVPAPAPQGAPAPAAKKQIEDMGGRGITLGNVPLEQARPKVAREVADVQGAEVSAPKIDIGALGATSTMPNRNKIVEALGSLRSQTPEAARTATAKAFETAANREGIAGMYQDILGRLKASDARQMDPKKLAQEEFRAFLRGAAGKSTFGLAGAGGGAAAADVRRQQQIAEDARLMRELGLTKEAMLAESEIGAKGFQEGMRAFEQASQDRRSAIDATIALSESDRRAYDAASDRKVQTAIAQGKLDSEALGRQLDRSMELLKFYSDEKQRGIENRDALQKAASEQLQQIKEIENTIRDAVYTDMAFQIQAAEAAAARDPSDATLAEEVAALKQERTRQVAAAMSGLGDNLGRSGVDLNALRDRWMTIMSQAFLMPRQGSSSSGMGGKDSTTATLDDFLSGTQLGE